MSTRVLVTGGTGFIGSHLVDRLLTAGYEVTALVRSLERARALELSGGERVRWVCGHLHDSAALQKACLGQDALIHSAAMASDWGTIREILHHNVTGTEQLARAAVAAGVKRWIQISSTDIYGYPNQINVTESYQGRGQFTNWYAESKLRAEQVLKLTLDAAHLPYVILRPATVYGPRSTALVGGIGRALRSRQMFYINGGGSVAGLCHIFDLADGVIASLTTEATGEAFNLADGGQITWKEFLEGMAEGLGVKAPQWNLSYPIARSLGTTLEGGYRWIRVFSGLSGDALLSRQAVDIMGTHQSFSIQKAREHLKFNPQIDWCKGRETSLHWFRTKYL